MLGINSPDVSITISFLRLLNVKVTRKSITDALLTHPNYPSLLSISDTLTKWNVPNGAGKINKDEVDQLPVPFMAQMPSSKYQYAIVLNVSNDSITFKEPFKSLNETKVERPIFFENWNGVYLLAEASVNSGEKGYLSKRRKEAMDLVMPIIALIFFAVINFTLLHSKIVAETALNSLQVRGIYLLFFIKLVGALITAMIVWYEIDSSSPFLKKFCHGFKYSNCEIILKNKSARVFSWLTWGDIGFIYFVGGELYMSYCTKISGSSAILSWLSVLTVPYIVFSLYYQWQIAKKWCIFCLATQLVLLSELTNSYFHPLFSAFGSGLKVSVLMFILTFTVVSVGYFSCKQLIQTLLKTKSVSQEFQRLKYNRDVFEFLLKKQPAIHQETDGLGIVLGSENAKNSIIKVCNPYCGPCSKSHPVLMRLLNKNEGLKVQIIYNVPTAENDKAKQPVAHLLAIANMKSPSLTIQALNDWYLPNVKNYGLFCKKYLLDRNIKDQNETILAMNNWCKEMKIRFTPTYFFNGYQLPNNYDIDDLRYFLFD